MTENKTPQMTANNIDEFNEQARSFVTKAKSNGVSNTAIANTIQMMYGLYTQKKNEESGWQLTDIDGDGQMEWVNPATQEVQYANIPDMPGSAADITDDTSDSMNLENIQEKIDNKIGLTDEEYEFYKNNFKPSSNLETTTTPTIDPNSALGITQAIDSKIYGKDPITGASNKGIDLSGVDLSGVDYSLGNPESRDYFAPINQPNPLSKNPYLKDLKL